jgi:hypothetical protein
MQVLQRLTALVLRSIRDVEYNPPPHTLLCDHDSRFYRERNGQPVPESNGFSVLHHALIQGNFDLVGARTRNAIFTMLPDGSVEPDFAAPLHPTNEHANIGHGVGSSRWMMGGGILGKTPVILSLLSIIAKHHPTERAEDAAMTEIAVQTGLQWDVIRTCLVSNNNPPDRENARKQLLRWKGTNHHVTRRYRAEDDKFLRRFTHDLQRLAVSLNRPVLILLDALERIVIHQKLKREGHGLDNGHGGWHT